MNVPYQGMRRLVNRKVAGVLLMSLLLVFAGCSGGGNGTTEAPTTNASDGGDSADGGDGGDSGDGGMALYEWSEGETYNYEANPGPLPAYDVIWTVESVSDGTVTANATIQGGGQTQSAELTGSQAAMYQRAIDSDIQQVSDFAALGGVPAAVAAGEDLSEGNTWTVTSDDMSLSYEGQPSEVTVEVVSTGDSVNGVECATIEITPEEGSTTTACIAEDYPFALSAETEVQGATVTLTFTGADGR
jgi:hypothetical protein